MYFKNYARQEIVLSVVFVRVCVCLFINVLEPNISKTAVEIHVDRLG